MSEETEKLYFEIFTLLKSIDHIEGYQQIYSDPNTFFPANYQKIYNDKVFLLLNIKEEIRKVQEDREE